MIPWHQLSLSKYSMPAMPSTSTKKSALFTLDLPDNGYYLALDQCFDECCAAIFQNKNYISSKYTLGNPLPSQTQIVESMMANNKRYHFLINLKSIL